MGFIKKEMKFSEFLTLREEIFSHSGFLWFHPLLSSSFTLQHFFKLYHIFVFFLRLRFISLLHFAGMQLLRSRTRPRLVAKTHVCSHWKHTLPHTLNQPDTNICFGFCINVLSCTSSSAAFIGFILIYYPDCSWTKVYINSHFMCHLQWKTFFFILSTQIRSEHHYVQPACFAYCSVSGLAWIWLYLIFLFLCLWVCVFGDAKFFRLLWFPLQQVIHHSGFCHISKCLCMFGFWLDKGSNLKM